jgi:uncharacterized protein (TIGR02246 family)
MSGNVLRRAGIGVAAALASIPAMLSPLCADPSTKNSPEQAISRALTDWMLAFNAGDTGAVCGLFAPELRYDYRGFPERGYDEVCHVLLGSLADQSRKYAYDLTIKEIIVSGDLAAVRLVWTLTVKRPGQMSGPATYEPGLDLFRRQNDGTWKIIRYMAFEE